MMSNKCIVVFLCLVAYAASQTYTKLEYSDCGSKNLQITRFTYLPMPIIQPGPGKLSFAVSSTERIRGVIKADVNIMRTVNKIKLPVRCYIVEGENFGSCVYPDLCALIKRVLKYDATTCPAQLGQYGINCNCPVDINKNTLDIDLDVELPKAPSFADWLSVGDFDVKLKATVGTISGCYDFKFAVKPK